ncbi:MAG: metallophosphatase [Chitinophagales bacterium]
MLHRRDFIKRSLAAGALLSAGAFPLEAFAAEELTKITILHTNDQHSRIDPFPMDGSKNQGCGGFAKRAAVIHAFRQKEKNVLLLDSGDIFQGTPYFNKFHGELEIDLMNQMGYDAGTIGNHDFDGGMDNLAMRMQQAKFPFVVANYNFENTACAGKAKRYKTFQFGAVRVGVFGVGIEMDGLVPKSAYLETQYADPVKVANETAAHLKHEEHCDFIICLSHLGFKYEENKVSDVVLAEQSENVDLILGGHTHTFFDAPKSYRNKTGREVLVNQVGWAGICLGQLEFYFDRKKKAGNRAGLIKI